MDATWTKTLVAAVSGAATAFVLLSLAAPQNTQYYTASTTAAQIRSVDALRVPQVKVAAARFQAPAAAEQMLVVRSEPAVRPIMTDSLMSTLAFAAGCVAALGMATKLRPVRKEEDFITLAIGGTAELTEAPAVIGLDPDPNSIRRRMEAMLRAGQDKVCAAIEKADGKAKFRTDAWCRAAEAAGGGGISRVLADGAIWEKAGVNLSVVWGQMPQEALRAATDKADVYMKNMGIKPGEKVPFFVAGLSCVMHPRNPHCPTMHFNYRYFELDANNWWFGGGTDITPAYLDEEDMKHFHGTYKKVCDKHDPEFHQKFKQWADQYFLIKHRGETRGLGGIFFDDLNDRDKDAILAFCTECLDSVVPAYVPIIEKHKNDPFTEEQKRWQLLRRGRYTEFNLVYDRGTIFGLKAGGRIESILMTIPETARWEYNHQPAPGSEEEKIMKCFKNPRNFV